MRTLLRHRDVWLGCAMLWIILFHYGFELQNPLLYFKELGYGGVDLCLFASGVGCYFSLEKDADPLRFYKRRLVRLGPAYLCSILIWLFCKTRTAGFPPEAVIGNLLGIQSLTDSGNDFNWYISALLVFYLLAPYLKALADRINHPVGHILTFCVLLLLSVPFWNAFSYIVAVTRLPVFYAGFLFAKQCRGEKPLGSFHIFAYILAVFAGILLLYLAQHFLSSLLWSHGLSWYPFLLIAPGLCVLISCLANAVENLRPCQWLLSLLAFLGKYSFEIYLVHIPLYEALTPWIDRFPSAAEKTLLWFGTIPLIALGCALLRFASKALCRAAKRLPSLIPISIR